MINQAIILAAGNNSRFLSERGEGFFKQELQLGEESIFIRLIRQLTSINCSHFCIVCGLNESKLRSLIENEPDFKELDFTFILNSETEKGNGHSLGLALPSAKEAFYVCMSDHVYDESFFEIVKSTDINQSVLFTDQKIEQIFDLEDATKVKSHNGLLLNLGKSIRSYDCVDTGFFQLHKDLLHTYKSMSTKTISISLSAIIMEYAKGHRFMVQDIGNALWQDIDNEAMYLKAKQLFS